jgi:acetone carboxylase gamma subunit
MDLTRKGYTVRFYLKKQNNKINTNKQKSWRLHSSIHCSLHLLESCSQIYPQHSSGDSKYKTLRKTFPDKWIDE